jgi:lipopolysaccharide transport system ATP-binding protein
MSSILEVRNISKRFRITHEEQPYLSLREKLSNIFRSSVTREEFWALKDVNFTVQPGESLGIIGRNGAGKSTLLKILSRITPPTTGKIISRGKIASLLEVGTGFHPELTGRENVFFNGSILGMKRHHVKARFDEIVDFAGTEKFLDTPLKHYSSGMQLRLAFAVAAFLEPEILVIDEVLAVGDAEFQKKCLGKMTDVSRSGRTILFVSHNMIAVENLCTRCILISEGSIQSQGPSSEIVREYLSLSSENSVEIKDLLTVSRRQGSGKVKICWIRLADTASVTLGDTAEFTIELQNYSEPENKQIYLAITIFNQHGVKLTTLDNLYTEQKLLVRNGRFQIRCSVPGFKLTPGKYRVDLWCADAYETYDMMEDAFLFSVEPADIFGTGKVHDYTKHGNLLIENQWENVS